MPPFEQTPVPLPFDEEEAKNRRAQLALERRFFGSREADELVGLGVKVLSPSLQKRIAFGAAIFNLTLDRQRMGELGIISEDGMVAPEWEDFLVFGSPSDALNAIRSGMLVPSARQVKMILEGSNANVLKDNVDTLRAIGAFEPAICDKGAADRLIERAPMFVLDLIKGRDAFFDVNQARRLVWRLLDDGYGDDDGGFFRELVRLGVITPGFFGASDVDALIEKKPAVAIAWARFTHLRLTTDQARRLLTALTPDPTLRAISRKFSDIAGFSHLFLSPRDRFIHFADLREMGVFEPGVVTPALVRRLMKANAGLVLTAFNHGALELDRAQLEALRDQDDIGAWEFSVCVRALAERGVSSAEAVRKKVGSRPDIALSLVERGELTVTHDLFVELLAIDLLTQVKFSLHDEAQLEAIFARQGRLTESDIARLADALLQRVQGRTGKIYQIEYLERLAKVCGAGERSCAFLRVCERVTASPSASLRKISGEIIGQLRTATDPLAAYEKIAAVFERNNLPLVGKVYKVFEAINTKERLETTLQNKALSPTLRAESHRARLFTVYKDLLGIHLDSNNPSLRAYLEAFRFGEAVAAKLDQEGPLALSEEEKRRFTTFVRRCERLFEQSLYGQRKPPAPKPVDESPVLEAYRRLREDLRVGAGQTLAARVADMYLRPLGIATLDEALARMDRASAHADQRNRAWIEASGGRIRLKAGDLVKGCDQEYLENILQNGSVAKEYLGPSANSDATPYDTDLGRVIPADADQDLLKTLKASPAWAYGDVFLVVRDRGQFQEMRAKDDPSDLVRVALQRETHVELFYSGTVDAFRRRHYGIRTGFASSQIDAIVVNESVRAKTEALDPCIASIVAQGHYIPVLDVHGDVLFTPAQYDEYRRRFFSGIGGQPFLLERSPREQASLHLLRLEAVLRAKRLERPETVATSQALQATVLGVLASQGVQTEQRAHELLTRAELYETGSTARGTNVPGSADFDFMLKLSATDMDKAGTIGAALAKALGGTHHQGSTSRQLRLLGVQIGETVADVDIGFHHKTETDAYESHQSVRERLASIGRQDGEEVQARVIANIVLAKEVLKEAEAYKAVEQGGLGGIGVENWILSEGGSLVVACESFVRAAYQGPALRSFKEFKQRYKILNPAINAKTSMHDSYLEKMTEQGYRKMAAAVREYLFGLDG